MMRTVLAFVLSRSISMTGIIIVMLCISPLLIRCYKAKVRYYAWLIVLAGFLVLWEPQKTGENSLIVWTEEKQIDWETEEANDAGIERTEVMEEESVSSERKHEIFKKRPQMGQIVFLLWLSGFFIVIFYQTGKHIHFVRMIRRWSRQYMSIGFDREKLDLWEKPDGDKGRKICRSRQQLFVQICPSVTTPMLTGLFSPVILLPEKEYDTKELSFILKHELVHYKRKDLWYKLLMVIVSAVHWFNPFLHFIFQNIHQECEISCDEEVLLGAGKEERFYYIEIMIGMIRHEKAMISRVSALFYGKEHGMKKRITAIMETGKKKTGAAVFLMVLAGTMIAGTGKNVSTINYINKDNNGIQHDIGIELVVSHTSREVLTSLNEHEGFMNEVDFRAELNRVFADKCEELMNMDYVDSEDYFHKLEQQEIKAAKEMEQWAVENMEGGNCEITNITFNNLWFS